MRKPGELEKGSLDPVRQGDALLEVPLRLVEPHGPELGDAEVDQGQRAQVLAEPELWCVRVLARGEQAPRLFDDGGPVAALTSEEEPKDGDPDLVGPAPVGGHRRPG